jgi:histidinol-phosphate aminotransferase
MTIKGVRRAVKGLKPYVPGKTIEEVRRELGLESIIKLGSNENAYAPFPAALKAMARELENSNRYPDIAFEEIKGLIAGLHGVEPENIAISHGAEGMLQAVVKSFLEEGDEVVIPEATYNLYRELSKLMGAAIVNVPMKGRSIDLEAVKAAVREKTKLVWLCNPNNPTGTFFTHDELVELMDGLPEHTWVILDEAYAEFAPQGKLPDRGKLIKEGHNILSVRTFSKAYGLAGLRLGYGMARPEMITVIDTVSEPFNANRIGIAAGVAVLTEDREDCRRALGKIIKDRERMERKLRELGCDVTPSAANFVFFETPADCVTLADLMLQKGVIVRSCDIWGYDRGIRVTVGTSEEVDLFLETLRDALREPGIKNQLSTGDDAHGSF